MRWKMMPAGERARLCVVLLLVGAVVVGACHDLASPTPSDPFAGSWSGTIQDRESGPGTLRVMLSGDFALSGTWSAAIAGQSLSGSASLTPPGTSARALTLTCESAPARGAVAVVASVNGATLEGSYFALDCPRLVGGSINLQRQ